MRKIYQFLPILILALLSFALMGCPPSVDEKIREQTRVPGLEEATQSVDRAIESAVRMNIQGDPVLDWYARTYGLTIECSHAVVTVHMKVSSQKLHDQAIELAGTDDRIKEIIDEIEIDENIERCPIEDIW